MAIDRADWHYGGDYPADLAPENGGTHIGMFLAWAIMNRHESTLLRRESAQSIALVRARRMTGREFLFAECDGRLWGDDLDEAGKAFAERYYMIETDESYLADYERVFGEEVPTLYHVADTWENYDRIAPVITERFTHWRAGRG